MAKWNETHGKVEKKDKKYWKKVLTNGDGFGNISERSEIQQRTAPWKLNNEKKKKPLKINLRSTFKYNSNSCEEQEKKSVETDWAIKLWKWFEHLRVFRYNF